MVFIIFRVIVDDSSHSGASVSFAGVRKSKLVIYVNNCRAVLLIVLCLVSSSVSCGARLH